MGTPRRYADGNIETKRSVTLVALGRGRIEGVNSDRVKCQRGLDGTYSREEVEMWEKS